MNGWTPEMQAVLNARAQKGRAPIEVKPVREAFLASGLAANEVARRIGWFRKPSAAYLQRRPRCGLVPDQGRVTRALGLVPYNPGRGYPPRLRERMTYDMALKIAAALNVDPWEVGL